MIPHCHAASNPITTVICDMDNTLFDFVTAKREACRGIVEYAGAGDAEECFRYFLRGVHGFEHHDNIRDYLNTIGICCPETFGACCRIYEDAKLRGLEPYPEVDATLRRLRDAGLRLAVATDAELSQAEKRLARTGLIDHFELVVTPDVSGKRKPEPDSFLYILREFGASPRSAMIVGDSPARDIAGGRRLGMATAFAAYGDWRTDTSGEHGADYVLQRFSDLLAHLGLLR
ncbi:HAD family hydrolase [Methanoculleus frigidifontis]|nr:HAD-IA family hydrolase [Methanoculleus sp. FWC-SCC1]